MSHVLKKEAFFRVDAFDRADLAIVFGGPPPYLEQRIGEAVRLLKSGRVSKLLLTGDGRGRHSADRTEADRMREWAIQHGVTANDLFIEDESQDTITNAVNCQTMLRTDDRLVSVRKVALVTSAWHMLRTYIIVRQHFDPTIEILCHPTPDGYTATNWSTDHEGKQRVQTELVLIKQLLRHGYQLPSNYASRPFGEEHR